ncbi:MAG: hypothetical protein SFU91_13330 [Chloroherpetonaceae bacterium]|nr:hypothetical protein [Chloroherpetonaceae bacterium]
MNFVSEISSNMVAVFDNIGIPLNPTEVSLVVGVGVNAEIGKSGDASIQGSAQLVAEIPIKGNGSTEISASANMSVGGIDLVQAKASINTDGKANAGGAAMGVTLSTSDGGTIGFAASGSKVGGAVETNRRNQSFEMNAPLKVARIPAIIGVKAKQ